MDATLHAALAASIEPGSLVMIVHGTDEQPAEVSLVPPGSQARIAVRDDKSLLAAAILHLAARLQAVEVELAALGPGFAAPSRHRDPIPPFPAPCPGDLWDAPTKSPCNA